MMHKTIIYLLLILACFSCTPFGTKSKIYRHESFIKPTTVGYYCFSLNLLDKELEQKSDSLFRSFLSENIEALTGAQPKFLGYIASDEDFEKVKNDIEKFDVILAANLRLVEMRTFGRTRRFNSTVVTLITSGKSSRLIMETKFNTNWGKSYAQHPELELAIKDGVYGAIMPYYKQRIFKIGI